VHEDAGFVPQPPEPAGEQRVVALEQVRTELVHDEEHHERGPLRLRRTPAGREQQRAGGQGTRLSWQRAHAAGPGARPARIRPGWQRVPPPGQRMSTVPPMIRLPGRRRKGPGRYVLALNIRMPAPTAKTRLGSHAATTGGRLPVAPAAPAIRKSMR